MTDRFLTGDGLLRPALGGNETSLRERVIAGPASVGCRHSGSVIEGQPVNGVRFDLVSPGGLLAHIEAFVECGKSHIIHFFPAHPTVLARKDPLYRKVVNRGDLNVADGASVSMALRLLGAQTARITGSDALGLIAQWGVGRGLKHCFYGSEPVVVKRVCAALRASYPGIEIVDAYSPPFRSEDEIDIDTAAELMHRADADVVWVGLGVPKQDLVADKLCELDAAPVILCVGAAFEFLAGTKRRAPLWMRRLGLEWLHRLFSEPRRLWRRYLIGNPQFVAGVLSDYLRNGRRRS